MLLTYTADHLLVASTFKSILDKIAEPALLRAIFHFGVYQRGHRHRDTIEIDRTSSTNRVTTRTGYQQELEQVIITAPLGWLKRNQTVFLPPLPARIGIFEH